MLLDIFKEKRCFKLVLGAGNEDEFSVEKLVTLYSKAGGNFFDLSANPKIIEAAKRGLKRAGIEEERYLCCSVGIKGDPHINKADINSEICSSCGRCKNECLEDAIFFNGKTYEVNKSKCIGCAKCYNVCSNSSIKINSQNQDIKEILPQIIKQGIDCIEFHTQSSDEYGINEIWEYINNSFGGILSICVNRSLTGDENIINRIKRLIKIRKPYTTIIQTDGNPMSGGQDDYKTTLQTVALAEIIQNANLPVYVMLSGGTNSKSTELAKLCGVRADGIAIGSFARKIVHKYIDREDFLENKEIFNEALKLAKNLVDISLGNMK